MQFSTKIDGFEQKDSQGFEKSYNSYEQYPLEKFFIFTIYQNYTLALRYTWILYAQKYKSTYTSLQKFIWNHEVQWNLVIKRSDITKPSLYNKVILLVPALYISLFFYPDILRNLI